MDTPSPEDLTSPSLHPSLPTPWLLSPLLTSFSDEKKKKKKVTHLLYVCLNNIYILLSFLFSFFSCLLSNIAHQSSLAGTS